MGVWKRLQRRGKNACKFQFTISYQELLVKATKEKWFPKKISLNWTRRSRDHRLQIREWVSSEDDACLGLVNWRVPENVAAEITLYRGQRDDEFEDKDWTFNLETTDKTGKPKVMATAKINMKKYATISPSPQIVKLDFKYPSDRYQQVQLSFTISCSLIKEGLATDDDMISLASLMSYGSAADTSDDVGNMADFEDIDSATNSFASFTAQMGSFINNADDTESLNLNASPPTSSFDSLPQPLLTEPRNKPLMFVGTPPATPPCTRREGSRFNAKLSESGSPPMKPREKHVSHSVNSNKQEEVVASTPVTANANEDLLTWAKTVTKDYRNIKVTNFTTSWRNGMAFCAVIHHYKPDLMTRYLPSSPEKGNIEKGKRGNYHTRISVQMCRRVSDLDSLDPKDIKQNNKTAFDVAAKLGITRVIEPADMVAMKVPDRLHVKTYLHELRTFFTGHTVQPKQLAPPPRKKIASYVFDHETYDTDGCSAMLEIKGLDIHRVLPSRQYSADYTVTNLATNDYVFSRNCRPNHHDALSADNEIDLDKLLEEHVTQRETTPDREPPPKPARSSQPPVREAVTADTSAYTSLAAAQPLMTRKELMNPFDSEDEDDPYADLITAQSSPKETASPTAEVISVVTDDVTSQASTTPADVKNTDSRREAAPIPSDKQVDSCANKEPTMPVTDVKKYGTEEEKFNDLRARARFLLQQARSKTKSSTANKGNVDTDTKYGEEVKTSQLSGSIHSQPCDTDQQIYDAHEYVYLEMASIERDQEVIDRQAARLEVKLRRAMNKGDILKEEVLTEQWFILVNKKNALIHRQEELNLLEKEENLNIKYDLLKRELRQILSLEEWEKSAYQKEKEQSLLDELVSVVDKRDALVTQVEQQQISLEEDEATQQKVKQAVRSGTSLDSQRQQCTIQ